GKIVLVDREVPISPEKDPELFKKWRPYSFHPYKVKNAVNHGAVGMLYNYLVANPNCIYIEDLILSHVGKTVVADIFLGTGRDHEKIVEKICQKRKPQSFNTQKIISIRNVTEHHPEGIGRNVLGYIEGSDPEMKKEAVMLSAHLDHLGLNHLLMPGANDNASGVAVLLGVAEAIHNSGVKPKRSIIFSFFGAEEQGVKGSEYYLQHPFTINEKNEKLIGFLNLDGVGRGKSITVLAGKNYPDLYHYIEEANKKYIHREIIAVDFHNRARPRLDAAHFMWAGVPTLSFTTGGAEPLPYETYHNTLDNPGIITPEIMEDLAQLLFIAVMEMAK
ncbi:MAG TPA: M20/M25/M40 family metallo-hydrolase, partial [Candidatus Kapabacteria bacterium]|nr:M20/M25/M40 family metallo-hydrolase [Candidatus Kapabacteria bacterium]